MAGRPHLAAFGGMCSHWNAHLPPADTSLTGCVCLANTNALLPSYENLVFDACVEVGVGVRLLLRRDDQPRVHSGR